MNTFFSNWRSPPQRAEEMAGRTQSQGRSVTSKVTAILRTFACGERQSVAEVAKLTGLPPTTTYRLLKELERGEILERSAGGMYQPGRQLRLIGRQLSDRLRVSDRSYGQVVRLQDRRGPASAAPPARPRVARA
jgi:DNA-binding IclR family transcriptional regulator